MRISDWSSDVCSSDLREAAHEVRNRVDRAERHDVVDAREVADTDGADGQPLHRAGDAARGDHVALVERVLELDEEAGDDVLHPLLRTDADREPDHAGTAQQPPDLPPRPSQPPPAPRRP